MLKRNVLLMGMLVTGIITGQGPLRSNGNSDPAGAADSPDPAERSKVGAGVREKAGTTGTMRVFLALSTQIDRARVARAKAAFAPRIQALDYEARRVRPFDQAAQARRRETAAQRDQLIVAERKEIARQALELYAPQQTTIGSLVKALGGKVLERFSSANLLLVEVPSYALPQLEAHSDIVGIFAPAAKQLHLGTSVKVLGAPAIWAAGYRGGTQAVATLDSGIASQHVGFRGVPIEAYKKVDYGVQDACAIETDVDTEDHVGHGTHVAGIIASQGTSNAPDLIGVAPGVGRLISVKVGVTGSGKGDCGDLVITTADILAALEFAVIEKGAQVVNVSIGASTRLDDQLENWFLDKVSDDFDVIIAVSAGNSGQVATSYQIGDLALSYNAVAVANVDTHRTLTRTDDTIAPSSSRGPTPLGRRKPDVAAPGTNITSLFPGDQVATMTGTSMAAPHIAALAALLRDAGVETARAVKALLLNSAQGAGWSPYAGWGSADAAAAFAQRDFVVTSTVAAGSPRYYRVIVDGSAKATLVWNRHIDSISPDGKNAFGDYRDLNLEVFEENTNRSVVASSSKIDNVEQINLTGSGVAVLKVTQNSSDSQEEEFALALSNGNYEEVKPARLKVSCAGADEVVATMKFVVTCRAENIGALEVYGLTFGLTTPTGFTATRVAAKDMIPGGGQYDFRFEAASPATALGLNKYTVNVAGVAFGDRLVAALPMAINIGPIERQECTMVLTPASGSLSLSSVAQTFVLQIRFPAFNPRQPGLCSWSTFSASPWFGITGTKNGVGDGEVTVNVAAAPASSIYRARSGSVAITLNSVRINYSFEQLYRK